MDMWWKHPFSVILARSSNFGESYFIKNMLDNAERMWSVMHHNIVWCYHCCQPLYKQLLCKYPFINFVEQLPHTFEGVQLFPTHVNTKYMVLFKNPRINDKLLHLLG